MLAGTPALATALFEQLGHAREDSTRIDAEKVRGPGLRQGLSTARAVPGVRPNRISRRRTVAGAPVAAT
jgi:hypothetical protein